MSLATRSWLFRLPPTAIPRRLVSQRVPIGQRSFGQCCSSRIEHSTRPDQANSDLLRSIESLRPTKTTRVLKNEDYNALCKRLDLSYTVPQLRLYLKTHNRHIRTSARKQDLLELIVNKFWGFSSRELIQKSERERKKNMIKAHSKATKEQLFFIIGDEGLTLRKIEEDYNVHITILVDQCQYIIEGIRKDVAKAQEEIRHHLQLVYTDVQITQQLKGNVSFNDVTAKLIPIIPSISKRSETFISINDGVFTLAGRSKDSLEQAKLLLAQTISELDLSTKRPLSAADYTLLDVTQAKQKLEFVPIHDSQAMPLTLKPFGWSRIRPAEGQKEIHISNAQPLSFYNLGANSSSDHENLSAPDIKNLLEQQIGPADDSNIHLEARFGAILYENLGPKKSSILGTPLAGTFNAKELKDFTAEFHGRRLFYGIQPPSNITAPFVPVVSDTGIHRRSVVLEYINRSDLVCFTSPSATTASENPLHRVRLEFLVQEDGTLRLEKAEGESKRASIDLMKVTGNVDVRVLVKKYTAFSSPGMTRVPDTYSHTTLPTPLQAIVDQCALVGYSDFYCPPSFELDSSMDLLEVSFRNEARYMNDRNLVTLSDIDAQYSQARQTELTVTPMDNDDISQPSHGYVQPRNGLDRWDTFAETVRHIAKRWSYSFR